MKKLFNRKLMFLIVLFPVLANVVFAGDWEARAKLSLDQAGITEAVLLPELLLQRPDGAYDLSLSGPDGRPRSFELYMKGKSGKKEVSLLPLKIELTDNGGFIWESKTPDKLLTEIRVNIDDRNYTGKVHVEGKVAGDWHYIARNQAVYKSSGTARAVIDISDGNYQAIRLHFISFDKRFEQKIVPIKEVAGFVKETGKSYVYSKIDLTERIRRAEINGFTEVQTLLPGKGLNINTVILTTEIQFQGLWEIGHEIINRGKSEFVVLKNGHISHVDSEEQTIAIRIDREWPAKSLILRLKADTGYVGAITSLSVKTRLPRIVFLADTPGEFTAYTGTGNRKKILKYPGDSKRSEDQLAVFVQPERNPDYNKEALVDKYRIMGGPFNDAGYLWSAAVNIGDPGYYKLKFNLAASLDREYKKVRLVKEGVQIPFFFGRDEDKTIDLEVVSDYDAKKNKSSWTIAIPKVSDRWKFLELTSSGIFKRTVVFLKKKPGNTGWERIYSKNWQNKTTDEARFRQEFTYVFKNHEEIKIEIDHGDNQPLHIKSFKGAYRSPSINFLAHETGDYHLFGGNRNIKPADYDLSLIQQRLLETLPVEIEMETIEKEEAEGWRTKFVQQFQDQGWGLYLILGLVTIFLLGIIVRLFPKVAATQNVEHQDIKKIDHKD